MNTTNTTNPTDGDIFVIPSKRIATQQQPRPHPRNSATAIATASSKSHIHKSTTGAKATQRIDHTITQQWPHPQQHPRISATASAPATTTNLLWQGATLKTTSNSTIPIKHLHNCYKRKPTNTSLPNLINTIIKSHSQPKKAQNKRSPRPSLPQKVLTPTQSE